PWRDFELVERHAGFMRGKLGEDGVGAGADVLRTAGDADGAIVAELHIGLGANARCDPRTPGRSPAERQSIPLHVGNLGIAFRPTKFFGAKLKALEEMTRRKWNAQSLVDFRFVEDAKPNGIDLELISQ